MEQPETLAEAPLTIDRNKPVDRLGERPLQLRERDRPRTRIAPQGKRSMCGQGPTLKPVD